MADRTEPPHNRDAECAALGALLHGADWPSALSAVHFHDPRLRLIAMALEAMHREGQAGDVVAASQWMDDKGTLAKAGGPALLAELYEGSVGPTTADAWAEVVAQLALRRRMAHAGEALRMAALEGDRKPADVLAAHEAELAALAPDGGPLDEGGDDWTQPAPARDWLIEQWLPAGRVAMLTGEGGAGKSRLALQLAAAVAAGQRQWLPDADARHDLQTAAPAVAVVASYEDERGETARRLQGYEAPSFKGTRTAAAVGDRLRLVRPAGPLWAPDPGGSKHTSTLGVLTPAGRALRRYCEQREARLLVADPRSAAFALNENDRALVRQFLADWDAWCQATGCAMLIIAHPPKAAAQYSGSTDWQAGARAAWELGLAAVNDDHDMAPRLRCFKSSYATLPAAYWLKDYPRWRATQADNAATAWGKTAAAKAAKTKAKAAKTNRKRGVDNRGVPHSGQIV